MQLYCWYHSKWTHVTMNDCYILHIVTDRVLLAQESLQDLQFTYPTHTKLLHANTRLTSDGLRRRECPEGNIYLPFPPPSWHHPDLSLGPYWSWLEGIFATFLYGSPEFILFGASQHISIFLCQWHTSIPPTFAKKGLRQGGQVFLHKVSRCF